MTLLTRCAGLCQDPRMATLIYYELGRYRVEYARTAPEDMPVYRITTQGPDGGWRVVREYPADLDIDREHLADAVQDVHRLHHSS